jgi:hypothetical protein
MNTLFMVALLFINGATGSRLRAQTKAATRTKATTVDGVEFTSIFDHPETARHFVDKDPKEVGHMITSAIYAHVKSHQKWATRNNIREPNSLKHEAFVQLAAKHGLDFSTLKQLHARRVNPKDKDMEVWFHELAMHKDTHVTHDEYILLEEQDKQAKEALAKTNTVQHATSTTAHQKKPFVKRYVIAPNDRYFAPDYDKHAHLAPLNERRQKRHLFSSSQKTLGPSFLEAKKATRASNLHAGATAAQRRKWRQTLTELFEAKKESVSLFEAKMRERKTTRKLGDVAGLKNNKKMKQRVQINKQNNQDLNSILVNKATATTFLQTRVGRWETCACSCEWSPDLVCDGLEFTAEVATYGADAATRVANAAAAETERLARVAEAAALALMCPENVAYSHDCDLDCECASGHCDNTVGVGTGKCVR